MLGILGNDRLVLTTPSLAQAALTLATSLFTENVDVEDITLKFNKKDVRSDEDWYELVQCLKAGHEEDSLKNTIRIFTVDVLKRQ